MDPFSRLGDENRDQVRKYLHFLRSKKDNVLRALKHEISDTQNDRLQDNMYSREEMEEYTDALASHINVSL